MVVFTGASVEEAIQKGLNELDLPRMKAHIRVLAREKNGFLGFGKKPAQVDVEPISETTVSKADQQAVRGVPKTINEKNEPVKTVSQETVDLGKVVTAIKKAEEKGQEISEEIKSEILKNEKHVETVLEEQGEKELLSGNTGIIDLSARREAQKLKEDSISDVDVAEAVLNQDETGDFDDLGISLEPSYDIDEVVEQVTDYVQKIVNEMDVDADISSSYNRRTINMQIDTNEPGRIIGYHGKVLKSLQLLAQNYLYNRYEKNFYISINVNDYVEHRAEVLQSYAQKLADRVLEFGQRQHTDPMSNSERKIIHRIISRIEGVTSYSEGDEPNRYVVVDIEG
ncbi:RNA-binding protein Jag [Streptococcus sp. DD10]|uniref:RNA-binding cell elongation regulator Jag/EloR n=1 Tax=Streptococcus sp. DD10 TaxID=1777878 RepID=UPI000792AB19|nr:RNA-binding cell elongation regulator Jag/EloR [Streptococcus sp. DD10]KXT74485.1 RNA-binding protein Jag [Streptococcus sp. DD10]